MKRLFWCLALLVLPLSAMAEPIRASRTLPAGTVIAAADLIVPPEGNPTLADALIGLQTRVTIYADRPVSETQLRVARLIARNQIVPLILDNGTLRIETTGRAMAEGAAGEIIPVMNLGSRQTISARVDPDGTLRISR